MDPQHGRADEAGEQMLSELDAIQERLRALKRKLDARESVVSIDDEDGNQRDGVSLVSTGGKNLPAA